MLSVTIDTTAAKAVLAAYSGPLLAAKLAATLTEAALLGERLVAAKTPVKTGVARASIKAAGMGPLAWKISSPLEYVTILESGSRPHEIRPKSARILSFTSGGTKVFARRVRHPGTKGVQMFARSVPEISAALPMIAARNLK